ncbi:reverse transcriptase domain-containing protein, partial [Tanacetum coccineum]
MQRIGIVVSTIHGALKFHTPKGIGTVLSTYEPPKRHKRKKKSKATCSAIAKNVLSCEYAEERIVFNTKYQEQTIVIGKQLPTNIKEKLQKILIANVNVFAWTYVDMTGIPRTIIVGGKSFNMEHKLNEYKHIKLIMKKRRGLGSDHNKAACRGVEELTKADTYKGSHQIQMVEEDKDKTSFFTGKEVFCYRRMPFGLKNAGPTYLRLVDKVFSNQIERNLEAYVDDMVINSTFEEDMLQDIQETFDRF